MTHERGRIALTHGAIGEYLDERIKYWNSSLKSASAAGATPKANEARHKLAVLEQVRFALLGSDDSE